MYMPNQVIVTGFPDRMDKVVGYLGLEDPSSFNLGQEREGRLYQIGEDSPVEQVICELELIRDEMGFAPRDVIVEPNYHMSPAGWAGGASPWTQNGAWTTGLRGGGLDEAPAAEFLSQWALREADGIGLYDENGTRVSEEYRGAGIRVGIFDTSPFGNEVGEEGEQALDFGELLGAEYAASIGGQSSLIVRHFPLIPADNCPGGELEGQDISNHGLFVAGLVHAVAPDSEIYLIRVLEDDGCGALSSIAEGIELFMQDALIDLAGGEIQGIVLNLSLGVHQPPRPDRFGLPEEVLFLEDALQRARSQGAVIVAAAGNDSYADLAQPSSMELPAGYDFVIGVAASNVNRGRGCFSNANLAGDPIDVAAPGGDGDQPCEIPVCQQGNADQCLVSLSRNSSTGYAYWVGTSFATPLVTGLEALLLSGPEATADPTPSGEKTCSAADTITLPDGIIYLPQALNGESCP